jgi:23S rRNA (pseudouridine1915-N3)-methyltransferase
VKVDIHAVGRMKAGPDKDLADRYLDRFARSGSAIGFDFSGVAEIAESRAAQAAERMREESHRLAGTAHGALVLLDERGLNLTSQQFADRLAAMRDSGAKQATFAVGGPDGHDPAMRGAAAFVWSFGALTWPHQLVRIMLAEQLYRAVTIITGHPYHRA